MNAAGNVAMAAVPSFLRWRSWYRYGDRDRAYAAPKGLRMLRDGSPIVRANVVPPSCSPAASRRSESGVTIHIRDAATTAVDGHLRRPAPNPNERMTVLAEYGELIDNDTARFWSQQGVVQRQQVTERDRRW